MRFLKKSFLLLLLAVPVSVFAQNVKFANNFPEAGSIVKFSYDPAGTKLAELQNIDCQAYAFTANSPNSTKINLLKEGALYKAEVPTTDSTTMVALVFSSGTVKDEQPAGYVIKLAKNGIIPAEAYVTEAYVYDAYGQYYLGMKTNPGKAASAYEEAFKLKPSLKEKHLTSYLWLQYRINKQVGSRLMDENINRLLAIKPESEQNLTTVYSLFSMLRQKAKSDSIERIIVSKYPKSPIAYAFFFNAVYAEKSAPAMEKKLNELVQKFGLDIDKKSDQDKLTPAFRKLAGLYANEKNYDKFRFYSDRISNKVTLAGFYNSVAWALAEKNEENSFGADLSKKSLDLISAAKNDKAPSYYTSNEKYIKDLEHNYATFADTYALLLYNLGRYDEAVFYQEKAMDFSDIPGNERYVMYLDFSGNKEKAFKTAEGFLKAGKGTEAMKERFRVLYEKKSLNVPFETFMAGIEKSALENEREEWRKKMINIPAPDFSLVNLKGETVRLSSLKGKVVIVDYWATWCGPCVASFPGMQKAVTKYSSNPDVVFLFVNTWQTEENREKLVKDFIAEKNVTFNVLFDTKNKQDPSIFDVVSAYKVDGIPAKFVIGPDGNIRFKEVGFSGSADLVVKELDNMIQLASGAGSK